MVHEFTRCGTPCHDQKRHLFHQASLTTRVTYACRLRYSIEISMSVPWHFVRSNLSQSLTALASKHGKSECEVCLKEYPDG